MLFHEINKSFLCVFFLLLLPLHSRESGMLKQAVGTLAGSMAFVDENEKKWLANAPKVTVELEHEGQIISLVSDDLGAYIVELPPGTYDLKSARNGDGKQLRFSPKQHKCFKIEQNKTTRFDVMLLKL